MSGPSFCLKEPGTPAGKSYALLVLFRRMCFIMALKVAPAVGYAGVFEIQSPGCNVRPKMVVSKLIKWLLFVRVP